MGWRMFDHGSVLGAAEFYDLYTDPREEPGEMTEAFQVRQDVNCLEERINYQHGCDTPGVNDRNGRTCRCWSHWHETRQC